MSVGAGPPPSRVPTLTEVIELGEAAQLSSPQGALQEPSPKTSPEPPHQSVPPLDETANAPRAVDAAPISVPVPVPAATSTPLPDDGDLIAEVLTDVQRQVELMLEPRLREAVMPALLRATDALVFELRIELANALQGLVTRAVAQQLALRRAGSPPDEAPANPDA